MSCRSMLLMMCVGAGLAPALGQAAIYTVGLGASCTHSTIQSAVDAARSEPGTDQIRITNTMSYVQQAIDIVGSGSLQLEGGYAGCWSTTPGATRTRIDGAGGTRAPVVAIKDSSVRLMNLELVNGDHEGLGGGVSIGGGNDTYLRLVNVRVANNSALDGAGIAVFDAAWLDVDTDSVVEANNAKRNGGGVYCSGARANLRGQRSRIAANQAYSGGGMYALDCTVLALGGTIASNVAHGSGGGMYVSSGVTHIYTTDPDAPPSLASNRATMFGGAIFAVDSYIGVHAAIIEGNGAGAGGGAGWLQATNDRSHLHFSAHPLTDLGGVACRDSRNCARISHNFARDAKGVNRDGAAFVLVASGSAAAPANTLIIEGASIVGNLGHTLVHSTVDSGWDVEVSLRSTEVRGNAVSGNLIELMASPEGRSRAHGLKVLGSTIAANSIGGPTVLHTQHYALVDRSIVWQPGDRVLEGGDSELAPEAVFTIASDLEGFVPSPTSMVADPRFVNTIGGDLHLASDSPAIDYASWDPTDTYLQDRDGVFRGVDLGISDRYGPVDLGAFEWVPVICCAWGG